MGATSSPWRISPSQSAHRVNGCVERAQSTCRCELNATYDFAYRFNHHRPHDALGGKNLSKVCPSSQPR